MLEVEATDHHGYMATRSGPNILEAKKAKKLITSVSQKTSEIDPWLLLNVNRKS